MSRRGTRAPARRLGPTRLSDGEPALGGVLGLGRRGARGRGVLAWGLAAVGLVLLGWLASRPAAPRVVKPPERRMEAALVDLPPPPPEPPPEPEPVVELPRPKPPRATERAPLEPPPPPESSAEAAPTPTEAAEAGQVVAVAGEAPMSPDDFRMAVGAGLSYVGGLTAGTGTAKEPVKGGGDGKGSGPPKVDRSRGAWPERADWDCGAWPVRGDAERVASIRAHIDAKGRPVWVEVTRAASPEIARWAQACAMRERFFPARDADGRSIEQTIGPLKVRFMRQ